MPRNGLGTIMRYILGLLITFGLLVLLIVLIFRGGGEQPRAPGTQKPLVSYGCTDAEASLLLDGPVNAASLHNRIKITVDRNNVSFERQEGYDGKVTNMQKFPNTENSFAAFLKALGQA